MYRKMGHKYFAKLHESSLLIANIVKDAMSGPR